ncbi:MAG: SagB/ThcOx family dehydrogenase [Betaproteobacteria bacterium]|nr:MAG: SagB/ThcOx family dehydrogenase [Betaproteobacteria bacterium]
MSIDRVVRYHEETKHHFFRFARAPGTMDWANQPSPFRRYAGAPRVRLAILPPCESPRYEELYLPGTIAQAPLQIRTLSRFLEYALAISAWKQAGDVRWALRSNPSSGNLHPTEGYLLVGALAGLAPFPALCHYAADEHALELRAELPRKAFESLMRAFPAGAFLLGFASVNWRETWKYGERAFRYCQHDIGHALGAARFAARTLGWRMRLLDGASDDTIAALLGIDRDADFAGAEREHPDCLAVVWPGDAAVRLPATLSVPPAFRAATWHGSANRLSRDDPVQWPLLGEVEAASWKHSTEHALIDVQTASRSGAARGGPAAGQVIRQRRSALAFDAKTSVAAARFFGMLECSMPRGMPLDVLGWAPAIHLALFVHRVEGLPAGLYMLARDPARVGALRAATHPHFAWTPPPGCPADLPLFLLQEGDARELAAQLSCRQEIAGDSAFSLGMIAEFEPRLRQHGAWFYRRLFWEAGVIGQVLYLEAEAAGVRATGIGCFFDDPVHDVLGFRDRAFQSLYHFTTGGPLDDPRLTTLPAYGIRA